ncbi:MAG: tRNA (adenosine(37)-N6)-threonylcarbamoyltransferase complex ATPase subunit type 1 TsaE [Desulfobulbaceae bacterium]
MFSLVLRTIEDTRRFGRVLGRLCRPGDVILLEGDLGAGKTTLAGFIAEGLEVPAEYYVTSPSFALMHEYPGRVMLHHIDCYRLEGEDDVEESGLFDYIVAPDGVTVVEWPDRLGSLVPEERLELFIRLLEDGARYVEIRPHGSRWSERIGEIARAAGGSTEK